MLKQKSTVFFILFISYAIFSAWVYTAGTEARKPMPFSEEELLGKTLWQKNNCISCHQLYGLGGYLGPDLTNIISDPKRGRNYAAAFIKGGGPTMPAFHFTKQETDAILAYLTHVDASIKNNDQ